MAVELRAYQRQGLDDIRRALAGGSRRPLYVLPTGGGKTVMFAQIARGAASRSNRTYILTHRREIMRQTLRKLYQLGVLAGQIASGSPMHQQQPVQVAMVTTIVKRLEHLRRPDLIIVDEAHHAVAGQWKRVLDYWGEVPRIGFTATPERLDGRGLHDVFDSLTLGPSSAELVKAGYLSYPVVFRPAREQVIELHIKRGDYDRVEQATALSSRAVVGSVIEHYRETLNGMPAIAFCPTVDHAHLVADQFKDAGFRAAPVWGSMPDTQRDAAIEGLAGGRLNVVTSCDVISEGVDVPVVAGAILLRRTLSLSLYLQQVGRALRPFPGKERAVILDHVGNRYLHGHVLDHREWSLDSVKRDPRKSAAPVTTECPQCYGVWPGRPGRCPNCRFDFRREERERQRAEFRQLEGKLQEEHPDVDGELVHVAAQALRAGSHKDRQKRLWAEAYRLAGREDARERIAELGRLLGYKSRWADVVYEKVIKTHRSKVAS